MKMTQIEKNRLRTRNARKLSLKWNVSHIIALRYLKTHRLGEEHTHKGVECNWECRWHKLYPRI